MASARDARNGREKASAVCCCPVFGTKGRKDAFRLLQRPARCGGGLWLDLWLWVLTRFDDKPNWMAYTAIAVLLALHIGLATLLVACFW